MKIRFETLCGCSREVVGAGVARRIVVDFRSSLGRHTRTFELVERLLPYDTATGPARVTEETFVYREVLT